MITEYIRQSHFPIISIFHFIDLLQLYLTLSLGLKRNANTQRAMSISETELVEQLFLDFTVQEVLQKDTRGFPIVEPWASEYVNAIRERRFGDAVWARYHIDGGVHDGIIEDTNKTVLQMIEEDALGYRVGDPDLYAEALSSVYERTSASDGHRDVIDLLTRIGNQDIKELRAQARAKHRAELLADELEF
ncbi:hypothetical protein CBS147332_2301 [Penicillium roqueforti]|nr:hypothetical protein CBS147332_2301 [Penicillium roqueforti]KAI3109818.1 hypothetical protein CBS147331_5247 [Penicillium roqueforti]